MSGEPGPRPEPEIDPEPADGPGGVDAVPDWEAAEPDPLTPDQPRSAQVPDQELPDEIEAPEEPDQDHTRAEDSASDEPD